MSLLFTNIKKRNNFVAEVGIEPHFMVMSHICDHHIASAILAYCLSQVFGFNLVKIKLKIKNMYFKSFTKHKGIIIFQNSQI